MSGDALKETAPPDHACEHQSLIAVLANDLYQHEVLDARRMSPEEKLILGERLFGWACAITLEGIRFQNPTASEVECQQLLRERIALGKELGTL